MKNHRGYYPILLAYLHMLMSGSFHTTTNKTDSNAVVLLIRVLFTEKGIMVIAQTMRNMENDNGIRFTNLLITTL